MLQPLQARNLLYKIVDQLFSAVAIYVVSYLHVISAIQRKLCVFVQIEVDAASLGSGCIVKQYQHQVQLTLILDGT